MDDIDSIIRELKEEYRKLLEAEIYPEIKLGGYRDAISDLEIIVKQIRLEKIKS